MDVDVDGAPTAYGPPGSKSLDYLSNAHFMGRQDAAIVGYMTEHYALRRYNQELERRRSADLGERDLFSISEPPR